MFELQKRNWLLDQSGVLVMLNPGRITTAKGTKLPVVRKAKNYNNFFRLLFFGQIILRNVACTADVDHTISGILFLYFLPDV